MTTTEASNDSQPRRPTLAELVQGYLDKIADLDGEFTVELEEHEGAIEEKLAAYKRIKALLESHAAYFHADAARQLARARRVEQQISDMKKRALGAMQALGVTRVSTPHDGNVSITSQPSVKLPEGWAETAPAEWVKTRREPMRALLLASYKDSVRALTAAGLTRDAAEAEALAGLPDGVTIEFSESVRL